MFKASDYSIKTFVYLNSNCREVTSPSQEIVQDSRFYLVWHNTLSGNTLSVLCNSVETTVLKHWCQTYFVDFVDLFCNSYHLFCRMSL